MKVLGRVTDLETGEPVPEVLVRLVDHESVLVETRSGSDGRYALELDLGARPHLLGRPGQVKASREGYEPGMAEFTIAEQDQQFDLQVHGRPEVLEVLVNQLDGSPIEGVEVLFTMGKAVLERGLTDAQGLTRWQVPPHRLDQQALLKVNKNGWYKVERLALLRRDQPRMQVTLEQASTDDVPLSGRILDQRGEPVQGAKVTLGITGLTTPVLTTDSQGRWSLVLEANHYGGEGLLNAEHPDFHPAREVKLPLMPNAMHIVPLTPLKAGAGGRLPWLWIAAVAAVVLVALWFFRTH